MEEFIDRRSFLKTSVAAGIAAAGASFFKNEAYAALSAEQLTTYAEPELVAFQERKANTKKVLVLVDYQVDFVNGSLGNPNAQAIEKNVYNKVKEYLDRKDIVIYTMDTHPADTYASTREGALVKPHCIPGTPGWEIYGSVAKLVTPETAIMVKKGTYGSTDIVNVLKFLIHQGTNIESIEMAGVSSNVCVFHNTMIIYNFFPEIKLMFNKNASAARAADIHEAILKQLAAFGVIITES
jgi:nicotinamidase-related amidase